MHNYIYYIYSKEVWFDGVDEIFIERPEEKSTKGGGVLSASEISAKLTTPGTKAT